MEFVGRVKHIKLQNIYPIQHDGNWKCLAKLQQGFVSVSKIFHNELQ